VRPQDEQEGSMHKEDRTGNGENARLMPWDDFPGICESSHPAPVLPF